VLTAVLFLSRLLTTSISVYRGYSSILEYVAAGCITGTLYKCNMGLAGMAVGGGLGTDNFL
jgi:Tim17/Tim22/Tim23 family.